MSRKPKIGIVAGAMKHPRSVNLFADLTTSCDVATFAIDQEQFVNNYRSHIPLHVFENLKDMPGYMRSLEDYISDFDVLIGFESSRLSTFQMIRVAAKNQIPTAVVVNEFHPYFYQNYPNIRAVQADVFEHATRFWPTSRLAESMLRVEGVNPEQIARVSPSIDVSQFAPDETRRNRFRRHIGIETDSIVILAHRELEPWTYSDELLHGFRLLYVTNPQLASRIKLVFVGDGSCARELKYRCYDLNLGKSVIFIHQDSAPFSRDLYAASDFIFCPRRQRAEYHEDFPLDDLEAIAAGAVPIFKMGSLLSEFCGDSGVPLAEVNFQSIADGIAAVITKPGGIMRAVKNCRQVIVEHCDQAKLTGLIRDEVDRLVAQSNQMKANSYKAEEAVDALVHQIATGAEPNPLVRIEECLLNHELRATVRAQLLTQKGLILSSLGRLEEAFEALHDAVRMDESSMAAYRGLGFLSLKSHSHDEAISFFKKALSKDDKDVESMFGVGVVHRRLGLNDEALYWLERSLLIEPDNPKVKTALAQTCLDCHFPQNAIASLERIQGQIGEEASLLLTLGQLYLKDGKAQLGNEMVSRALEMQQREKSA